MREECRSRVFQNRVLRRIFGSKRDEVTGNWKKLHNEELNDLYSSPNTVLGDQLEKNEMGGACSMYGERRARVLLGKPEGKRPLGRGRCGWEDNIKIDFQEVMWGYGLD